MRFPLYITYDDKKIRDGFGAQGLRVVGIFSIARVFRLKYLHQGISEIGDKVELVGVTGDKFRYSRVLDELNSYLKFPSNYEPGNFKKQIQIEIHNLGFRTLLNYILLSLFRPNRYLLKVCLPFGVTDRFPWIYLFCRKYSPSTIPTLGKVDAGNVNVVHIRASEHSPDKTRPQLGPLYYEKLIFSPKFVPSNAVKWIVHTDFYDGDFSPGVNSERAVKFKSLISRINLEKNIDVYHYAEIEKVFRDMVNADLLIISRSALSYLAGVLCKGNVVYPSNHGHAKLPRWIKVAFE
jgi:hypothetical protein